MFKVYYHELDKSAVLQQNKELRGQKRILEDNVVNEAAKDFKLKENCNKPLADQKSPVGMTRTDLKFWSEKLPKWTRKIQEGSSFIVQGFGRSTSSIKRFGDRDSLFGGAAILNFGYTEQE